MEHRTGRPLTDEAVDEQLHTALRNAGALTPPTPPPQLVERAMRRLPPVPPRIAARNVQRRRRLLVSLSGMAAACAALIALIGAWVVLAYGENTRLAGLALALPGRAALDNAAILLIPHLPGSLPGELPLRIVLGVTGGLGMAVVALLWMNLWPARTAATALTLFQRPWRALVIGLLLTTALGGVVLPLLTIGATTLPGLLVAVPLLALLHLPYLYGLAALSRGLAAWNDRSRLSRQPGQAALIALTALVVPLILITIMAPLWGLGLGYLLVSCGVGAAIISRAGTTIPS
ncbi:MAG TPA: hypothetical protein PKA05_15470 [Roseiflexaceae bacterium]|nr:hypothetical protein [Roseiflexaceae bacterium]HMP41778.1 hypothetical protein [Roseiflexaceae bacterium]